MLHKRSHKFLKKKKKAAGIKRLSASSSSHTLKVHGKEEPFIESQGFQK